MTLKFDRWPWKTIGHLFYATSSFVHHFVAIGEFKLELQSGNAQSRSNSTIFRACDLEIWQMTLKNNRVPLLSNIKLYASFHHMWIQTGVTVWKRLSWVVTSVTLTFDLWPWPFAWTLLWSLVITPENFMMIRWWEHSQKGVTDRQTENTICRAAWSQLKIAGLLVNIDKGPVPSPCEFSRSPLTVTSIKTHFGGPFKGINTFKFLNI